jgi:hypothetical protein
MHVGMAISGLVMVVTVAPDAARLRRRLVKQGAVGLYPRTPLLAAGNPLAMLR